MIQIGVYPKAPIYNTLGQLIARQDIPFSYVQHVQVCFKKYWDIFGNVCKNQVIYANAPVKDIAGFATNTKYKLRVSYTTIRPNALYTIGNLVVETQ